MANVKISELPSLVPNGKSDDVIIVNEAASGTTCKSTLLHLLGKAVTINGSPNTQNGTLTWTQNSTAITTIPFIINRITPTFARVRALLSGGTINVANTSASAQDIVLNTGFEESGPDSIPCRCVFGGTALKPKDINSEYDVVSLEWALGTISGAQLKLTGVFKLPSGTIVRTPMQIPAGGSITINAIDIPFYAYSVTSFQ